MTKAIKKSCLAIAATISALDTTRLHWHWHGRRTKPKYHKKKYWSRRMNTRWKRVRHRCHCPCANHLRKRTFLWCDAIAELNIDCVMRNVGKCRLTNEQVIEQRFAMWKSRQKVTALILVMHKYTLEISICPVIDGQPFSNVGNQGQSWLTG